MEYEKDKTNQAFDLMNEGGEKLNLFAEEVEDIGLDKLNILQLDENKDYMDINELKETMIGYRASEKWNKRYYELIKKGKSHSEAISSFPVHLQSEAEDYVENPVEKPELTSDLDRKIWDLYVTDKHGSWGGDVYHELEDQIWNLKKMADEHLGGERYKKPPRYSGDTGSLGKQVRFSKIMDEFPYEDRPPVTGIKSPKQSSKGVTEKIFKKLLGM